MASLPRWAITIAILFGSLLALPYVGPAVDRWGLPGGAVVVLMLLGIIALSLRFLVGQFPPRGRRRMLLRHARQRGLRLKIRAKLPRSMWDLPSLSDPRVPWNETWHLIVVPDDPAILTFDRRVATDDAYERFAWIASAACRIPIEAPPLIVEPRPMITIDPFEPLIVWRSESEGFAHRSRIRTADRIFATTFLDQRMLEWLMERRPGWTYEVGGPWALVSRRSLEDEEGFDRAIEELRGFCERIPRVALTMFPPSPI